MKIRIGFVSNSSSSSFVIVGTEVKFKDIASEDKDITMLVDDIAEYTVAMDMKKADYRYLELHPEVITKLCMKFFKTVASGEEFELKKADMPDKVTVFTLEVDQYVPDSLEEAMKEMEG